MTTIPMPRIILKTFIKAPADICFDLSRSVDVHVASTDGSNERAVAGVTSGMMNLGDTVTWEAEHFGVRQRLTSKITAFDRPRLFVDEMRRGAFRRWRHTHYFKPADGGTLMVDDVDYASPLGPLGSLADALFLKSYMTRLLEARNDYIRKLAESRSTSG